MASKETTASGQSTTSDPTSLPDTTSSQSPSAPPDTQPAPQPTAKKRKKKKQQQQQQQRAKKKPAQTNNTLAQFSIRHPPWAYIHLRHLAPSTVIPPSTSRGGSQSEADLDPVTVHLHLTSALTQFLGLHGSAIPVDIVNVCGREVRIRIPAEDRTAVIAAVGGWVHGKSGEGWWVRGWSHWNARAGGGESAAQEPFDSG